MEISELEELMRLEGESDPPTDGDTFLRTIPNMPTGSGEPEEPASLVGSALVELAAIPGILHRPVSTTQTRCGLKVEIVGCSLDRIYGFIWHPEPESDLGELRLCRSCFPR